MTKKKEQNHKSKQKTNLLKRENRGTTIDTVQLLAARTGITVSELFNHSYVTYCIVPGMVEAEGITHKTYGIGALKNGVMVECIHDITSDFNKLKSLVLACNEGGLSLIHLQDVIEDFIS